MASAALIPPSIRSSAKTPQARIGDVLAGNRPHARPRIGTPSGNRRDDDEMATPNIPVSEQSGDKGKGHGINPE